MKQRYLSTPQIEAVLRILPNSYYYLLKLLFEEVVLRKTASYLA